MAHSVIALAATHDVQRFDCGTPELNAWLQQIAGQHGRKNLSKTFVLVDDDEPDKVLGYYALAVRAMTPKEKLSPCHRTRSRCICRFPSFRFNPVLPPALYPQVSATAADTLRVLRRLFTTHGRYTPPV